MSSIRIKIISHDKDKINENLRIDRTEKTITRIYPFKWSFSRIDIASTAMHAAILGDILLRKKNVNGQKCEKRLNKLAIKRESPNLTIGQENSIHPKDWAQACP